MTNKEFASALREIADFFEASPKAAQPHPELHCFFYEKDDFVKAVAELAHGGTVNKRVDDPADVSYPEYRASRTFSGITIQLHIARRLVCKLVQPAVYDCPDSLLEMAAEYEHNS